MKKNKQILSVFISVIMVVAGIALTGVISFAEEVNILDYLTYEIVDNAVTITDCDTSISGDVIIPGTIEGYPVTKIGAEAFRNCDSLTSVIIPDNIRHIGYAAFRTCDILTSVTISAGVTTIEYYAFRDCYKLENITVDENNQYFSNDEYGVLFNKEKTEIIQYPTGNSRTEYIIPDSVTTVKPSAFETCSKLTSITIPESVTTIDSYAFGKCRNITSITIPDGVKTIGYGAFYWCRSLAEVTIPDSVTHIASLAFGGCAALTSITILNPDCTIYDSADTFYSGTMIYAHIGSTAEAYAEKYSRNFVIIDENGEISVLNFLEYEIIDDEVIINTCDESVSGYIAVPDEINGYPVSAIGEQAFASCGSLTEIMLPDTVKSIPSNAFADCTALKKVIIPGVESIEAQAFSGCSALDTVVAFSDTIVIADTAFDVSEKLTIFVKNTAEITAPDTLNVISFSLADGTLSFSGEYKSDLYYLFDLVTVMCLYYDDVQYLFFDSFEAVSADEGHIYYYTDNMERFEFDGKIMTNVKLSVEVFDGEEFRKYSFNELCNEAAEGKLENFNLVIEESDEIDKGRVEITLVEQVNRIIQRILKALTNLLNKLFSFFRSMKG